MYTNLFFFFFSCYNSTTSCRSVFFFIFEKTGLFYRRRVVTSYDAKHSLDAALLDATYAGDNFTSAPSFVNFRTMRTTDEFWGWLEGPMLEVIHPQLDASSRALDVEDQQYVLGSNRIMGGVRLRQYRTGSDVSTGGCVCSSVPLVGGTTVSQVPIVKERGCYSDYSMDRQRVYVASLEGKYKKVKMEREMDCRFRFLRLPPSNLFYYIFHVSLLF